MSIAVFFFFFQITLTGTMFLVTSALLGYVSDLSLSFLILSTHSYVQDLFISVIPALLFLRFL